MTDLETTAIEALRAELKKARVKIERLQEYDKKSDKDYQELWDYLFALGADLPGGVSIELRAQGKGYDVCVRPRKFHSLPEAHRFASELSERLEEIDAQYAVPLEQTTAEE